MLFGILLWEYLVFSYWYTLMRNSSQLTYWRSRHADVFQLIEYFRLSQKTLCSFVNLWHLYYCGWTGWHLVLFSKRCSSMLSSCKEHLVSNYQSHLIKYSKLFFSTEAYACPGSVLRLFLESPHNDWNPFIPRNIIRIAINFCCLAFKIFLDWAKLCDPYWTKHLFPFKMSRTWQNIINNIWIVFFGPLVIAGFRKFQYPVPSFFKYRGGLSNNSDPRNFKFLVFFSCNLKKWWSSKLSKWAMVLMEISASLQPICQFHLWSNAWYMVYTKCLGSCGKHTSMITCACMHTHEGQNPE